MSSSQLPSIHFTSRTVDVTIHRCTNVFSDPTSGWLGRAQEYFVRITIGDVTQETSDQQVDEGIQTVTWNEGFTFTNATSSSMTLIVYRRRTVRKAKLIERLAVAIPNDDVQPTLVRAVTFLSGPKIEFSVLRRTDSPREVVTQTEAALAVGGIRGDQGINEQLKHDEFAQAEVEKARQALESSSSPKPQWRRVLEGIERFYNAMDVIAEAHPYAKLAFTVLYMIPSPLIKQLERDEELRSLLDSFTSFCETINRCGQSDLNKNEDLQGVLTRAGIQLAEVAYFVQEYSKDGSFLKRVLKNQLSDADNVIEEFRAKLDALKEEFSLKLSIKTGAIAARTEAIVRQVEVKIMLIINKVEELAQSANLDDIPYVPGAGLNEDKICLPGTRTCILDDIVQWASLDGEQVLLLLGGAGTGKSSIAHTIAARFRNMGRLGSMFCFSRAKQANRGPESLLPHIARDLADLNPYIRAVLSNAANNKADRTSSAIITQFEKLVLSPANAIREQLHGPIVVVIDALDESGTVEERKKLLDVLSSRLKELPSNFRVVITSRPARDIEQTFGRRANIVTKRMEDISSDTTKMDIAKFINSQLAEDPEVEVEIRQDLAAQAEDLFQWAYVACQFVLNREPEVTALDRYKALIPPPKKATSPTLPTTTATDALDDTRLNQLYRSVLLEALSPKGKVSMDEFKFVMTWILGAFEPLSCKSLNKLIAGSKFSRLGWKVERVVASLGSLMSGVGDHDIPVAPLHTSFRDFLTNIERSGEFFVDLSASAIHSDITWASLTIMEEELKFNICRLPTSHFANKDIPNRNELVSKYIPAHLAYACRFWIPHFCFVPLTTHDWRRLTYEVGHLLESRALFWLEVLSLLGSSETGLRETRRMYSLMKASKNVKQEILDLVQGLELFWSYFAKCISGSAPHIYVSALPFAPKESLIAKLYTPPNTKTLSIPTGQIRQYPACLNVLQGHTNTVRTVAISLDGTRIVSGSFDHTIRIWNAENGELVLGPLCGHSDWVRSVAFSPDGTRIISASDDKTIRIWDTESGKMVFNPLHGHTSKVLSATFSPNGSHFASGSTDSTIRVWNSEDGQMVLGPLRGHTDSVFSVVFSPDGTRIASGSADRTIRIWNAEDGQMVVGPLHGHTHFINSVAFSPDGTCVISGSEDETIRVWKADDGEMVLGPLTGHVGPVRSVVFSPDGFRFISCADDKTIRIWNAETGQLLLGPLTGHTDPVYSITLSPDGTRIISGSRDYTVRIWNSENAETSFAPVNGHNSPVIAVAFSQDGTRIVSSSDDKTVRVWNALNGEMVLGPLIGHTDAVISIAFSPDGTRIVSGSKDKTIRTWNAKSGHILLGPLTGHTDSVWSVTFSPDGSRIVSGSHDKTVRVWNGESGQMLFDPLNGHTNSVWSATFSPDGSRIASGSDDKTVRVWNADDGKMVLGPLSGHTSTVRSVAFSPDGTRIISGAEDWKIRIWDARTGEMLIGPLGGHTSWVTSVSFSPDGTRFISSSADKTIRIWDAENGQMVLGPLHGHTNWILSASFSPDGTRCVSGSHDSIIRIWDIQTIPVIDSANSTIEARERPGIKPHPLSDFWRIEDDWVFNTNGELLFYVPPVHRLCLYTPGTILCIGAPPTRLDLTHFAHGSSWEESFKSK